MRANWQRNFVAIPVDPTPNIGVQLEVEIRIDVCGVDPPDNALGSFTASLAWNPAVLACDRGSGLLADFTGLVNSSNASSGHIIFKGSNVTRATGNVTVLNVNSDVVG